MIFYLILTIIYWLIVLFVIAGIGPVAKRRGGTGWLWVLLGVAAYVMGSLVGAYYFLPFGNWLGVLVVYMSVFVLLGFGRATRSSWQCPECRMFQDPTTLVCGCGGRAPSAAVKVRSSLLLRCLIGIALVVGLFVAARSPLAMGFYQRQTYRNMESVRVALNNFYSQHSSYPKSLYALYPAIERISSIGLGPTDAWGRPLVYARYQGGYVLLSFGRDSRPDQKDYTYLWDLDPPLPPVDLCGSWDADLVATEKGWHFICSDVT